MDPALPPPDEDTRPGPRPGAWLRPVAAALFAMGCGFGLDALSAAAGYRGAALAFTLAAIVVSTIWLSRLDRQAPIISITAWSFIALAVAACVTAILAPSWQPYAITAAALAGIGAALTNSTRRRSLITLIGVAAIAAAVALMGRTVGPVDIGQGLALVGGGVAMIGLGVAALFLGETGQPAYGRRSSAPRLVDSPGPVRVSGGVACLGAGFAAVGLGVTQLTQPTLLGPLFGAGTIAFGIVGIGGGAAIMAGRRSLLRVAMRGMGFIIAGMGVGLILLGVASLVVGAIVTGLLAAGVGITCVAQGVAFLVKGNTLGEVLSIGFGVAIIGFGVAGLVRGSTPLGVAGIGLGVAFVGVRLTDLTSRDTLRGVACAGSGVAMACSGIALVVAELTLVGVACIGAGVAFVGFGVAVLQHTSSVRKLIRRLRSLTQPPASPSVPPNP